MGIIKTQISDSAYSHYCWHLVIITFLHRLRHLDVAWNYINFLYVQHSHNLSPKGQRVKILDTKDMVRKKIRERSVIISRVVIVDKTETYCSQRPAKGWVQGAGVR